MMRVAMAMPHTWLCDKWFLYCVCVCVYVCLYVCGVCKISVFVCMWCVNWCAATPIFITVLCSTEAITWNE